MTKPSKLLVIVAGLSLFVAAGSGPSANFGRADAEVSSAEWQRYKVEGEEFSVLLPAPPAMSTDMISYAVDRDRRERTLGAYADGVVYIVNTYEKKGISFDEVTSRNIATGTLKQIVVDGVNGKSSSGEIENAIWQARWFETNRNFYKFLAVASTLGDHSTAIARFFDSISFRKPPDGRAVTNGPGEQPLTFANGTDPDSIFRASQVTRARVISKPEPQYTESARRNQVTGTVILRAIFSASGAVENVTVIRDLPDGLTERAITAARQIRFIPSSKDGRFVSMWMQLEYNFNLY